MPSRFRTLSAAALLAASAASAPAWAQSTQPAAAGGAEDWAVMVKLDVAKLDPAPIRAAVQQMGPMAAMAQQPLAQYQAFYEKATAAGVQGVRLAMTVPPTPDQEPQTAFMVAMKPGSDPAAVKQLVGEAAGPKETDKLAFDPAGDSLVVHEKGRPLPNTSPETAKAFSDALAAGDGAVVVAMVPTDSIRTMATETLAKSAPPPLVKQMVPTLLASKWVSLSVALTPAPAISIAIEQPDKAGADKLAGQIDQGLGMAREFTARMRQQGQAQQANMMDSVIAPLKPAQDGSRLTMNLDAKASGLLVSVLLPALNKAREAANQVRSASNMRQLSQALLLYQNDHGGKSPETLDELVQYLKQSDLGTEMLNNPLSDDSPGYLYVKPGVSPDGGVFYESRNGQKDPNGAVCYVDGSVRRPKGQ